MKRSGKAAALILAVALLSSLAAVFPAAEAKTPVISLNPQSVRWPDNTEYLTYSCKCSNENIEYGYEFEREWYFRYDGMDYYAGYVMLDPGKYPFGDFDGAASGVIGPSIYFADPGPGMDGVEIYCVVKSDDSHFAESTRATVLIGDAKTTPTPPEFTSVPSEVTVALGSSVTLSCDYKQIAQGEHTPVWYASDTPKLYDIMAVTDAPESKSLTIKPDRIGDSYYFLGVEVETADGKYSSMSYSSPIHVKTVEPEPDPVDEGVSLEILSMPSKTSYFLGDTVDLKGLTVRYYTDLGFKDIKNGAGMGVFPATLTKYGTNTVTLLYEGLTVIFDVTVEGGPAIPVIDSVSGAVTATVGDDVKLSVSAHSNDGGLLSYQWYSTDVNDISTIMAIFDEDAGEYGAESSFVPPQTEGTVYYAVAVSNSVSGGTSAAVYSDLIPVTFTAAAAGSGSGGGAEDSGTAPGTGTGGGKGTAAPGTTESGGKSGTGAAAGLRTFIVVATGVLAALVVVIIAVVLISKVSDSEKKRGGR